MEIGILNGEPIFEVKSTPLEGWGKILKRIFDIILSAIGLVIFSIFFPFVAIAIKLDSAGYIFYSQERVGKNGKIFLYLGNVKNCDTIN